MNSSELNLTPVLQKIIFVQNIIQNYFGSDFLISAKNFHYQGYDFPQKNQFIYQTKQQNFLKSKDLLEIRFLCGLECLVKTHDTVSFFQKSFDCQDSPVFVMAPYFYDKVKNDDEYLISYKFKFEVKIQFAHTTNKIKKMCFLTYDKGSKFNHIKHKIKCVFNQKDNNFNEKIRKLSVKNFNSEFIARKLFIETKKQLPKKYIINSIHHIIKHMKKGESYLANMTHTQYIPDLNAFFNPTLFLIKWFEKKSTFGFYFMQDDIGIASFSPERFLIKSGHKIATQPIKGTQKISDTHDMCDVLWKKKKEIHEHTMVVDLLRHDLNSVCVPGSVHVNNPFYIKRTEKLFQMESTILGVLTKDFSYADSILQLLPGGSISGTPKKRTCELIEQYEFQNRGYYTGIAGIIELPKKTSGSKNFDFAILIRSLFKGRRGFYVGVGAGITTLSSAKDEFDEFCLKLGSFL